MLLKLIGSICYQRKEKGSLELSSFYIIDQSFKNNEIIQVKHLNEYKIYTLQESC